MISTGRAILRLRLGDFFSRMWLEKARLPRSFPFAVLRKRFLAPEWVFIFGMGRSSNQNRKSRCPGGVRGKGASALWGYPA